MDFILKYYNEIMSVIAVGNGVLLVFYWYSVNKLKKRWDCVQKENLKLQQMITTVHVRFHQVK